VCSSDLKFSGDTFTRTPFFGMDAEEKVCAIYLFCEATTAGLGGAFYFDHERCRLLLRDAHRKAHRVIEILIEHSILAQPRKSGMFVERKKEEKETNNSKAVSAPKVLEYDLQFEEAYASYPRKVGKKSGYKIYLREIKTPEDYANLKKAIFNYSEDLRRINAEPGRIKHFPTFMASWEDWINYENLVPKKTKYNPLTGKVEEDNGYL